MTAVFPILCVGLFAVVFAVILVVALTSAAKRKKEIGDAAAQLGFTPLAEADGELVARLTKLYAPYAVHKVSNLYSKPFGSETYYLLDCQTENPTRNSEGETSANSEFANVGVLSPALDLPPFMLMPRLPSMPAGLSGVLENLISLAASSAGLHEYDLVTPEFNSKYQLFVKEDARNEKVFSQPTLDWIARQEQIVARGVDDFLLFNRYNLRMKIKKEAGQLNGLAEGARQLCDFLVVPGEK